jgi:hypothetical protein
MPWFKVDDAFHTHPKVLSLRTGPCEDTAIALWAKAGSWCAANLTDGAVPAYVLETFVRKNAVKAADELVRVRLWEKIGDDYSFRSWAEYQPTAAQVRAEREASRRRLKRWRDSQPRNGDDTVDETPFQTPSETVTPTRPDPTHQSAIALSVREGPVPERPPVRHPNGVRSEALRLGYVERFRLVMPGIKLPSVAGPGNGGPWLEVARELTDEQVAPLLDAFFADETPFVACDRAPTKLPSQRVRLLNQGPTVNGEVRPTASTPTASSPLEAAWQEAQQAAHRALLAGADPATLHRLEQAEEAALASLRASRRKSA